MVTCSSCGNQVDAGVTICPRCGLAVMAGASTTALARRWRIGPAVAIVGAALIVALAGSTTLLAWEKYRPTKTTPAATPSATPPPALNFAERNLVSELAATHFERCTPERRPITSVSAAVNCALAGSDLATVLVLRFNSRSAMDDFMVPTFEVVDGNDCDDGQYQAYWDNDYGPERGVLNCWRTANGTAWLASSIDSTNIVVVATGTDLAAMYQWWLEVPFPDHE